MATSGLRLHSSMSGLSSCEERDVRFELRNKSAMSGLSSGTRAQTGHGDVRFEVSQLDVRFELRGKVLKPDIPELKPDMFFFVFGAKKSMSGLSSGTRAQTGHGDVRFEASQLDVRFELRGKVLKPDIPELKPDDLEPDITMSGLSSSAAGTSGLSSKLD